MACAKLIVNDASRLLENNQEINKASKPQSTLNVSLYHIMCQRAIHIGTPTFGVLVLLCLLLRGLGGPRLTTLNVSLNHIMCQRAIHIGTLTFGVLVLLCLLLRGLGGPRLTALVWVCLVPSFTTSAHDFATVTGKRC